MYGTVAEVELALDARARREPFDPDAIAARVRGRIDAARDAAKAGQGTEEAPDSAAHLTHAAAAATRLHDSDPEAWAEAALRWAHLADPYWLATARVREAEAAAARGATARAAEALREAYQLAASLPSEPVLADIEAVSRRTRLSVEPPVVAVLEEARNRSARPHPTGGRSPVPRRRRPDEPTDRRGTVRVREDGERPRLEHPSQARGQQQSRRRRGRATPRRHLNGRGQRVI